MFCGEAEYKESVAVDMDNTLVEFISWAGVEHFGEVFDGAHKFLKRLRTKYRVIIHTCRCNAELNKRPIQELIALVKAFLDKAELEHDVIWGGVGKPVATYYIDDRGVECSPSVDLDAYEKVCEKLGV